MRRRKTSLNIEKQVLIFLKIFVLSIFTTHLSSPSSAQLIPEEVCEPVPFVLCASGTSATATPGIDINSLDINIAVSDATKNIKRGHFPDALRSLQVRVLEDGESTLLLALKNGDLKSSVIKGNLTSILTSQTADKNASLFENGGVQYDARFNNGVRITFFVPFLNRERAAQLNLVNSLSELPAALAKLQSDNCVNTTGECVGLQGRIVLPITPITQTRVTQEFGLRGIAGEEFSTLIEFQKPGTTEIP